MRRRRGGVVLQPVQGIVHPLRREGRQRLGLALLAAPRTVDDGVVGHRQVGHVEQVAQRALERLEMLAFDIRALGESEVQRDGRIGFANLDRHAVVLQQLAHLFDQIVAKQRRLGDGGLVDAGFGHVAVRQAGIDGIVGFHQDTDGRVIGPGPFAAIGRAFQDFAERRPQECRVAGVDIRQPIDRRHRVLVGLERNGLGPVHRGQRVYCVHHALDSAFLWSCFQRPRSAIKPARADGTDYARPNRSMKCHIGPPDQTPSDA